MRNLLKVNTVTWMSLLLISLLMAACLPQQDGPDVVTFESETTIVPQRAAAPVEAIDILQGDTFPVQVRVIARGHFANECTKVDQIRQERRGGTFVIVIDSVQYLGQACPEGRIPFEESIALDVIDLPAGIYVVDVNGLQGALKLQRDNVRDEENAVVGGLVWLDDCTLARASSSSSIEAMAGCVEVGEGRYGGNGVRSTEEPGIGGVMVSLGAGICPSMGLATTLTAPDGTFLFSGLAAGDYCLTVTDDVLTENSLTVEGLWTAPPGFAGQQSVTLQPGESNLASEFGWTAIQSTTEPLFVATPVTRCTNKALFVADVTVPDGAEFTVGQPFTKTWQLQNLGSCTWDPDYSLVIAAGEQMGAPDSTPLTTSVPPGEFADLSVRLVAPETPGAYRGEWQLADPEGVRFGIGPGSDRSFWVQIVVVEEVDTG
jgi:hypothetical protein